MLNHCKTSHTDKIIGQKQQYFHCLKENINTYRQIELAISTTYKEIRHKLEDGKCYAVSK